MSGAARSPLQLIIPNGGVISIRVNIAVVMSPLNHMFPVLLQINHLKLLSCSETVR